MTDTLLSLDDLDKYGTAVLKHTIGGDRILDNTSLQFFDHKLDLQLIFTSMQSSVPVFKKGDFDGIIGLGVDSKHDNFMDQLVDAGMIKDMSYSIYINSNSAERGHIFFGGYDPEAVMEGRKLTTLDMNGDTLSVLWNDFIIGGDKIAYNNGSAQLVTFDPSYKDIYLPEVDFKMLNSKLRKIFYRFTDSFDDICDSILRFCYIETKCGYVRNK